MNSQKAGYIEGTVSILVNIGLFTVKLWAGIVSGSIALTADAWHTLSDSISSVIVILGSRLSSRKPDKAHPFGHGRWEQIASIFIGFLLGLIAYDFLRDSILNIRNGESANFGMLAIIVTIISIIVKEALAQYAFFLFRKTGNLSVKADGWHHRTDAISSLVVLLGILLSDRYWWIDSVLGIIIALILFYAAYDIIKQAIGKLLGEKPDDALIDQIEEIVKSESQDNLYPHHYHIHNYISSKELTFHIKVENSMDIESAHLIATNIEKKIYSKLSIVATIHIEPLNYKHDEINISR